MDKIEFLTGILKRMKKEVDKRDTLYECGVDLINYENEYFACLTDAINYIAGTDVTDEILWWLYEDVEKKGCIDGEVYNVKNAEDFLRFHLERK